MNVQALSSTSLAVVHAPPVAFASGAAPDPSEECVTPPSFSPRFLSHHLHPSPATLEVGKGGDVGGVGRGIGFALTSGDEAEALSSATTQGLCGGTLEGSVVAL